MKSPFFGFNPSRAHGPRPRTAVAVDATPTMNRSHIFRPAPVLLADAGLISAALASCTPSTSVSAWLAAAVQTTLLDFARVGPSVVESDSEPAPRAADAAGRTSVSAAPGLGRLRSRKLLSADSPAPRMRAVGRHGFVADAASCASLGSPEKKVTLGACQAACAASACNAINHNNRTMACELLHCASPLEAKMVLRGGGWYFFGSAESGMARRSPEPSVASLTADPLSEPPAAAADSSARAAKPPSFAYASAPGLVAAGEDCPRVGRVDGVDLAQCKTSCVDRAQCNGVNYNTAQKWCIMRGCLNPLLPALAGESSDWAFHGLDRVAAPAPAAALGTAASPPTVGAPPKASPAPLKFVRALGAGEASGEDCMLLVDSVGSSQTACEAGCTADERCNSYDIGQEGTCRLRQCHRPLAPWLSGDARWAHWGVTGGRRPAPGKAPAAGSGYRSHSLYAGGPCGIRNAILRDVGLPEEKDCGSAASLLAATRSNLRPHMALPTEGQLDGRCLENCFASSQRRRDIAISQGYQHYGTRHDGGRREPYHLPFLLKSSLPALAEWYGDAFVSLNYYAFGPPVPELNLDKCESDWPGGTSGHVIEVSSADGC